MKHTPYYSLFLPMLLFACGNQSPATSSATVVNPLKEAIHRITDSTKADIGVSIIDLENGDTLSVNGNKAYTIMSVIKFPQALYVLHLVDEGKINLNQRIHFTKEDFAPDTWSPLKEAQKGKPCDISLEEALTYTAGSSDNIVCDKLFELYGGPKEVTAYIQSLGVKDVSFGTNYREMMKNGIQANNATPNASALLLQKFARGKILSEPGHTLLWTIMSTSTHAADRLKALLPKYAIVAHKTGTYFTDSIPLEAINDIGIVKLPNGRNYAIAVYVNNSCETPEDTMHAIAEINKVAWDYFTQTNK